MTVSSFETPRSESSWENCSWLTKSRRTGSCRSCFQSSLIAPGMCPPSYAVVSSSTSTKTTPGVSRFFSAQSADTSAVSRLIGQLPCQMREGKSAHARTPRKVDQRLVRTAPLPGENERVPAAPSERGATQTGGHAAQVDRAPLCEQQ